MAELPYISTQKINPNAPSAAFGDYRGLQSVAQGMDQVADTVYGLQQKKKEKQRVGFIIENQEKAQELLSSNLSSEELITEYTNWFEAETASRFSDDSDEMKVQLFFPTLESREFREYVKQKEDEQEAEFAAYIADSFSARWTDSGKTSPDDYGAFLSAWGTSGSKDTALRLQIDDVALSNADSQDDFLAIGSNTLLKSEDPVHYQRLKDRFDARMGSLQKGTDSTVLNSIRDDYALSGVIDGSKGELVDSKFLDLIADPEDRNEAARLMVLTNLRLAALKNVSFANDEYFKRYVDNFDEAITETGTAYGIADPKSYFKSEDIRSFMAVVNKILDTPFNERLDSNPEVANHLAKGNLYMATKTKLEFLGKHIEGKTPFPKEWYAGHNKVMVTKDLFSDKIVDKYLADTDPLASPAEAIISERNAKKRELGEFFHAFQSSVIERSMELASSGDKTAVYHAITNWLPPEGVDFFRSGFSDTRGISRYADQQKITEGEARADLRFRISKLPAVEGFLNLFEAYKLPVPYDSIIDVLGSSVIANSHKTSGDIKSSVETLNTIFNATHVPMEIYGDTVVVPKEYFITPEGFTDVFRFTVSNALGEKHPYETDGSWVSLAKKRLESAVRNPLGMDTINGVPAVGLFSGVLIPNQEAVTAANNAVRWVRSGFRTAIESSEGAPPFTAMDPERFYWDGAPLDDTQEMWRRTQSNNFFRKTMVRYEIVYGPNGQPGVRLYTAAKTMTGKNPDYEEAVLNVPLIDRKTGDIAWISLDEIFGKEKFEKIKSPLPAAYPY